MLLTHVLALPLINFYARKSPYEYVHSVKIELTKIIFKLVGTRITYQATGDAGCTNHTPVWELHTSAATPPSLLFSVVSTTNLVRHNIFTSFVDRHKT